MMSDEFAKHDGGIGTGHSGVTIHLAVDDADQWWDRAVQAGATIKLPIDLRFWIDRYYNTPIHSVTLRRSVHR